MKLDKHDVIEIDVRGGVYPKFVDDAAFGLRSYSRVVLLSLKTPSQDQLVGVPFRCRGGLSCDFCRMVVG